MNDPAVPIRIIVGAQNAIELIASIMEMPGYGTKFRAVCVSSVEELNAFLAAEYGVRAVVIDYFFFKRIPAAFDFSQNPPQRLPGRLAPLTASGLREIIGVSDMEPYREDMKNDGCLRVCKPSELAGIIRGMVA